MKRLHADLTCVIWGHREKQKGLTTVEYAMAGALITAALVMAFGNLGAAVGSFINGIVNALS